MPGYAMDPKHQRGYGYVKCGHQPTEQRNVRAGRAHSEKLESLTIVAVKMPSGIAAPNCRNAHIKRRADGFESKQLWFRQIPIMGQESRDAPPKETRPGVLGRERIRQNRGPH